MPDGPHDAATSAGLGPGQAHARHAVTIATGISKCNSDGDVIRSTVRTTDWTTDENICVGVSQQHDVDEDECFRLGERKGNGSIPGLDTGQCRGLK